MGITSIAQEHPVLRVLTMQDVLAGGFNLRTPYMVRYLVKLCPRYL